MQVYNIQFETNQPMNTNIIGPALQLRNMFGYNIQVEFTGTPAGTFKLQASCDPFTGINPTILTGLYTPPNWTDVANSSTTVSAAGNYMWNVSSVMYNYVRLVYTDSSGGTSNAILTAAVFNGKGV